MESLRGAETCLHGSWRPQRCSAKAMVTLSGKEYYGACLIRWVRGKRETARGERRNEGVSRKERSGEWGYVQADYDVWYYLFNVVCYLAALTLESYGVTIQEYGLLGTYGNAIENRSQNVCLWKVHVHSCECITGSSTSFQPLSIRTLRLRIRPRPRVSLRNT